MHNNIRSLSNHSKNDNTTQQLLINRAMFLTFTVGDSIVYKKYNGVHYQILLK